ncbi:unnamed protein product [Bursaphelenchus xylophilus]|uniref:TATA box-binding protein-associated factor RNA polymerase I subunit B n=1 Tax=Bursaphelenchus xylophilus TaxID=6326 RepID=A0A1I7SMB4_BURXY|nr:unnamed protein product [Bursaphelenchus xylophilus]CAG9130089.1 unnamed protein product [Bursaphelenchus xylophilus]
MNICNQCGNTQFTVLDGLYYCRNCGQQILTLRELELEADRYDTLGPSLTNASILRTPKDKERRAPPPREAVVKEADVLHSVTSYSDYPRFSATVGKRLTTAALLLVKISRFLEKELKVSSELKGVVISLYQKYLIKFNVAFVDSEVDADEEKQFKMIMQKTNVEIKKEMKELKIKEKERNKAEKELRRSQMNVFEQVTQVEDREPERALAVDLIENVNLKLSIPSIRLAARVYLGIDLLLAITYTSLILLGKRNILYSDLLRWHREDRFKISKMQILSLVQAADHDQENPAKKMTNRVFFTQMISGVTPLIEGYSLLSMFLSVLQIPQVCPTPSSEMILKRFLYDLNLPLELYNRIKVIQGFILEPKPFFDQSWIKKHFPMSSKHVDELLEEADVVGPKAFLRCLMTFDFRTSMIYGLLSFETRMLSVLLFTLTLIFSQDFVSVGDEESGKHLFNVRAWLLQLTMKTQIRSGKSVDQVLSTKNNDDINLTSITMKRMYHLGKWNRERKVQTCLPERIFLSSKEKIFRECFPLDHSTAPSTSQRSLYAPYRSLSNQQDVDESSAYLDMNRRQILFLDFSKDRLPSLEPDDEENSLNDWRAFFPKFLTYKRIRRREMTTVSNGETHFLESRWTQNLYDNDKKFLHLSFLQCLALLATVIGEKEEILYLSFLMVEHMFFEMGDVEYHEDVDSEDLNEDCSEADTSNKADFCKGKNRRDKSKKVWRALVQSFW